MSKDTLSNIETDNNKNDAKTDVDMVSGKDDAEEDSGDFGTVAGAGVLVGIGYLVLRKKSKKKK